MSVVVHRFFIVLALFGLTANMLGLGYLIANIIRTIAGIGEF